MFVSDYIDINDIDKGLFNQSIINHYINILTKQYINDYEQHNNPFMLVNKIFYLADKTKNIYKLSYNIINNILKYTFENNDILLLKILLKDINKDFFINNITCVDGFINACLSNNKELIDLMIKEKIYSYNDNLYVAYLIVDCFRSKLIDIIMLLLNQVDIKTDNNFNVLPFKLIFNEALNIQNISILKLLLEKGYIFFETENYNKTNVKNKYVISKKKIKKYVQQYKDNETIINFFNNKK